MADNLRKLVTIITELSLEKTLIQELEDCGATGYTITNAQGKGDKGAREADWDANSNIRVEVICNAKVAEKINNRIIEKYYENFAMVSFSQDITILRPNKF
jgi:nitrogen regulatory protein PII